MGHIVVPPAGSPEIPDSFVHVAQKSLPGWRFEPLDHPRILHERTEVGQRYRQSLMKGAQIAVVSCGFDSTKKELYSVIHELGVGITLIEKSGNAFAAELEASGIVKYHRLDLSARKSLVEEVTAAVRESGAAACLTFWDDSVSLTARVCAKLGFVTNPYDVIDLCHDKGLARIAQTAKGLPVPLYFEVASLGELRKVMNQMSYPAIIKPAVGAASIGVFRVENVDDAERIFQEAQRVLREALEAEELSCLAFEIGTNGDGQGAAALSEKLVFESFIGGPEVDVDMVLSDGKVVYANVNDDLPFMPPWLIERGICFPSSHEKELYERFITEATRCCAAFGVRNGAVHVEMKNDPQLGPTLIELNPRVGGGPLRRFHLEAFGCDLGVEHVLTALGIPSNPPARTDPSFILSCIFLFNEGRTGVCTEDMDNDSAMFKLLINQKYVNYVDLPCKKGDLIHSWYDGSSPTHTGRVDFKVPADEMTPAEVVQYGHRLRKMVELPLGPMPDV